MALIDNLISYYKLDEIVGTNAEDSHGDNNGTANNARVFTSEVEGIINTGADFTQGSDFIYSSGNIGISGNEPFTISIWVKLDDVINKQTIWNLGVTGTFEKSIALRYMDTQQFNFVSWGAGINLFSDEIASFPDYVHIVATYNGSEGELYVDGVSMGTDAHEDLDLTDTKVYFGRRGASLTEYVDGSIDEVGIWTRALTAPEVTALWNDGNGLAYPFVVGTNMKINISDVFKDIDSLKINIGNVWKDVIKIQQNIGDVWKDVFG